MSLFTNKRPTTLGAKGKHFSSETHPPGQRNLKLAPNDQYKQDWNLLMWPIPRRLNSPFNLLGLVTQENGGHGGWPSGDKGVTLPIASIAVAIVLLANSMNNYFL